MNNNLRITIIIGIFVFGYFKFYGQTYIPTLGDTNSWKIVTGSVSSGFSTLTYFTDGTTTFIDTSWSNNDSIEFKNVYINYSSNQVGYIREDTNTKKLFWTNPIITKIYEMPAFVLCDFSLQVNDSIELFDFSALDITNLGYYNIDSIKFIPNQTGLKKTYYLSSKTLISGIIEHPVWIEGVGPIGDLMHPGRSPIEHDFGAISCAKRNDEQTYISQHAIDFGNCNIFVWVQVPIILVNYIEMYPNPTKDYVNICGNSNEIFDIFLYDNLGQLILNKKINGNDQINIKDFNAGLYYLKILDKEQPIIKKIIIEK